MSNSINWKEVLKFAGTYISVILGSGFATGQEILQFFSVHGLMSMGACVVCMVLLSFCGASLLDVGHSVKFKSNSDVFVHYCGKYIGTFFKGFIIIFMFSTFVVMISGTGATMNQYYGLNKYIGSFSMAVLAVVSVLMGLNKVIDILGSIGPVIVIVSITIGAITLFNNFEALSQVDNIVSNLEMTSAADHWLVSGALYASFNITLAAPFLVGVGSTASNKKNCLYGGILGGCAFIVAAAILNLGLLSDIQNLYNAEVPTLLLAENIAPVFGIIFSIMLLGGIYSTATPLLWTVCSTFADEGTKKFKILVIVGAAIGFLGGRLPFAQLVNLVYPFSGAIGLMLIVAIFFKKIFNNKKEPTESIE